MTDNELMNQYVLVTKEEYQTGTKAMQLLEIINEILDYADEYRQIPMIKLVLGKKEEKA